MQALIPRVIQSSSSLHLFHARIVLAPWSTAMLLAIGALVAVCNAVFVIHESSAFLTIFTSAVLSFTLSGSFSFPWLRAYASHVIPIVFYWEMHIFLRDIHIFGEIYSIGPVLLSMPRPGSCSVTRAFFFQSASDCISFFPGLRTSRLRHRQPVGGLVSHIHVPVSSDVFGGLGTDLAHVGHEQFSAALHKADVFQVR